MPADTIAAKLSRTALIWQRYNQKLLDPLGLTLKQYCLLKALEGEAFLFPSDLAQLLFCDRPTATVIINNLARHGYVSKNPDPTNRRYTRVSITEVGRQICHSADLLFKQRRTLRLTAGLDEREKAELHRILDKLLQQLEPLNQRFEQEEEVLP